MPKEEGSYLRGRGAQVNSHNRFLAQSYVQEHIEGLDEQYYENSKTEYINAFPRSIVNKVESPDVYFGQSVNPYQGCQHGCVYCFARNSHEYLGYSAGLDFERKILIKKNAPELLRILFNKPSYKPELIMLSGNTDCYQPVERKLGITRKLLEICLEYKHPVGIITKNNVILRDIDLLKKLAALNLVSTIISVTSLDEELRRKLEPQTVTSMERLRVIRMLSEANVPTGVMLGPIIPGLNSDEIPSIIKAAANEGAQYASRTIVRLNGAIASIFTDWIHKAYPERAEKVLNLIAACHGGTLNDSRWGTRMRGEGNIAESIHQLFKISVKKYLPLPSHPELDFSLFCPPNGKQLSLL